MILFAILPGRAEAADFTVIVLPDTQFYACTDDIDCAGDLGIYDAQTSWIASNRDALDIRYVASLGDCVQDADEQVQFDVANGAYSLLEQAVNGDYPDGIPFGVAVGNHDQVPTSDPGSIPTVDDVMHPNQALTTTLFNANFGVDRFCPGNVCRGYYGGHFGINNDNHYALFDAGEYRFVVVFIEYMPTSGPLRQAVTAWADEVLTRYSDRRAIVVSHHVMEHGLDAAFSDQGTALYEALKHQPNLFLILGGHVGGEGRRLDLFEGRTVHTLLSDYQGRTDGGAGWLRILEFQPATDTISVRTYSPWLDAYETDSNSEFVLDYDLGGGDPDDQASFQHGVDGWAGGVDTWIRQGDGPHGADETLSWGGDPSTAALIRFGGLFDTEGGPIPQGAQITSAVLHTVVHEPGDDATLHEALVQWDDAVDHTGLGPTPGAQPGEDYDPTPIAVLPGAAGVHAIDVTASVAAWSEDPSLDHGWVLVSAGVDEASLYSGDDAADPRDRPRLSVSWRTDAAAGAPRPVTLTHIDRAWVSAATPDTRSNGVLEVDTSGVFKHAFVAPADLGGLAPGAEVVRADLVLQIVDPGDHLQVREILEAWDPLTVSWNDSPATGVTVATVPGGATGEVSVDVTALVQGWVDGAPAYGVNLYPTGGNGVDIDDVRFELEVVDGEPCVEGCPVLQRRVLLTAVEDAHVASATPSTSFGSAPALELDTSPFKKVFLKPAHLADITPGSRVVRAELVLEAFGSGSSFEVREVLAAWDEGTVTFATAPPTGPALTLVPGTTGMHAVDVTDLVQRWVDGAPVHGVSLYPTGGNGVDIRSTEYVSSAARPYFSVEVTDGVDDGGDPGPQPRVVMVTELDDAYVSGGSPAAAFGGGATLEIDTSGTFKQAFVKPPNLGDVAPGAQVLRANLVLQIFDSGSQFEVREVLAPWDEATVTWNTAPATGPALSMAAAAVGEVSVDVTALVQAWVDGAPLNGVSLYPTGSNGVDFRSTEHADPALRPRLEIEVLEPAVQP